jgi:hypothetical protein
LAPAPYAYNSIIKSRELFWNKIDAENVLLFQVATSASPLDDATSMARSPHALDAAANPD